MDRDLKFLPLHMSVQDRFERLYNFLVSMGHIVYPICDDEDNIEYLHVEIDLPMPQHLTQASSKLCIPSEVKKSQIRETVATIQSLRNNVINFPSVR